MSGVLRIGIQGELGSFSHEAALRACGPEVCVVPHREFAGVLEALERGELDRAVVPVENTIAGSVAGSHDALAARPALRVTAETVVPIHHALLAPAGARLAALERVISHPVALAQCTGWLARHPHLRAEPVYDTAGAARDVAERGDPRLAAIASRAAGARYGLTVLAGEIEDRPDNQTRFWTVSREPVHPAETGSERIGVLLVSGAGHAGGLARLLAAVGEAGMPVRRIDSRPTGTPWEYHVFVELAHRPGALEPLLDRLGGGDGSPRLLGSFTPARPVRAAGHGAAGSRAPGAGACESHLLRHLAGAGVRALRGATTAERDAADAVHQATRELLDELLARNALAPADVVSALFTVTPDLTSEFPARAARAAGWDAVPLLCASEIPVPGAPARCIRVLLHVRRDGGASRHVYLRGARELRRDLAER